MAEELDNNFVEDNSDAVASVGTEKPTSSSEPGVETAALDKEKDQSAVNAVTDLATLSDAATSQSGDVQVIAAPTNGESVVYNLVSLEDIKFAFDLENTNVSLSDVDLVISFDDGSQVILAGAGVDLLYEADLNFDFNGQLVSKHDLVAEIGTFEEIKQF